MESVLEITKFEAEFALGLFCYVIETLKEEYKHKALTIEEKQRFDNLVSLQEKLHSFDVKDIKSGYYKEIRIIGDD